MQLWRFCVSSWHLYRRFLAFPTWPFSVLAVFCRFLRRNSREQGRFFAMPSCPEPHTWSETGSTTSKHTGEGVDHYQTYLFLYLPHTSLHDLVIQSYRTILFVVNHFFFCINLNSLPWKFNNDCSPAVRTITLLHVDSLGPLLRLCHWDQDPGRNFAADHHLHELWSSQTMTNYILYGQQLRQPYTTYLSLFRLVIIQCITTND